MTFLNRGWPVLLHLVYVTSSSWIPSKKFPLCEGGTVIFDARYALPGDVFHGSVELIDTLSLIWIGNVSVNHPYPQLRINDTSVEVNFTRRQEGILREFRRLLPNASNLGISYYCDLAEDFLCEAVCTFDEEEIDLADEEVGSGDLETGGLREICKKKEGLTFLQRSWEKVWKRWQTVCLYFETQKPIPVNVTFRHHTRESEIRCRVSVPEPVVCKARIYNGTEALGSAPCQQYADATVGAVVTHRVGETDELVELTCVVIGDMINETVVPLDQNVDVSMTATTRLRSAVGSKESQMAGGGGIGLAVGLLLVALVGSAVLVVAFRRRLGLRTLDRFVNRLISRFFYRLAVTKE